MHGGIVTTKSSPLVDDRNYTILSAGVLTGPMPRAEALARAESIHREWAELGYNGGRGRKVEVFYRDGSLVATFPGDNNS